MKLDAESLGIFINEFASYGFWGIFAFVFLIWGLPHVAPIISATGAIFNERHKTNLTHKRSMAKIENKKSQQRLGKDAGE